MTRNPRRSAAIVAAGATRQGEIPGKSGDEIAVDAFRLALEEAQIDKAQVDGLITCKSFGGGIDTAVGELCGINPCFSATLDYGTCNFSLHLAAMAIAEGLASTVAIMYGTNQRSQQRRFEAVPGADNGGASHGFLSVLGPAALAFQRHRWLYGTTEAQLGEIAVAQRAHAQLNPLAVFTEPLSLADYLALPYMVAPLRRPDLCMVSDGGACLILTSWERADAFPKAPVYLLGMAQQTALRQNQNRDNLLRPWLRDCALRVYAAAEIGPADVDLLYVQDPTSVWVLQALEHYGFCELGAGGAFLESGAIRLGGKLPVNTNGGQLSESYMWGWLHLCEAVRQLRGECGQRQVERARIALYCSTMVFQKAASSILSIERPG